MNGSTNRTKRTMMCKEVHKEVPSLDYKKVVALAKQHKLTGVNSSDVKDLLEIVKGYQQ